MASNTVYSVLHVDDHRLFRKGIAQLVGDAPNFYLAGGASNAREGILLAEELNPDVILMDLNMGKVSGIEALTELRIRGVTARVIIFTASNDESDILAAMKAGADGFLLKDCEPEDLIKKLHLAVTGLKVLSDELVPIVTHALRKKNYRPFLM